VSELPDGWAWPTLDELGQWMGGGTPSKSVASYWNGDIPWVSPKDMKVERIVDTEDHISKIALDKTATTLVPPGSVLVVTRSGILRHTLPVAVADRAVALNQDLKALLPEPGIDPAYVAWSLRCSADRILRECSKAGTTVSNIETPRLLAFRIPLAPLDEQRRIVAAIEVQLSRLDVADRSLAQAKRRLATLRAATLAASTQGHEAVELGALVTDLRYGTSIKCSYDADGPPVLRIPNVQSGNVDLSDLKFATDRDLDLSAFALERGDLLFVRTNGSRDLIGRVASVDGAEGMAFASYLIRARPDASRLDSRYAVIALSTPMSRALIESRAATTAGQYNLNLAALRSLPVSLPSIDEQRSIVADVERRLTVADAMDAQMDGVARQSRALRRAILAQAFRGELVLQDPDDEPAAMLLERIANQRALAPKRARQAKERAPA
jgi:type I restriction enzyme S subunit